jgi:hypothetical protein
VAPFVFCPNENELRYDDRLLRAPRGLSTLGAPSNQEGKTMKNPLDSLWGTVISGFILTVILYYVVKALAGG